MYVRFLVGCAMVVAFVIVGDGDGGGDDGFGVVSSVYICCVVFWVLF